jgi:hypothetical protein
MSFQQVHAANILISVVIKNAGLLITVIYMKKKTNAAYYCNSMIKFVELNRSRVHALVMIGRLKVGCYLKQHLISLKSIDV